MRPDRTYEAMTFDTPGGDPDPDSVFAFVAEGST